MKRTYEAPSLTIVGTIESLTAGTQLGDSTDKNFPQKTPRGELTFS